MTEGCIGCVKKTADRDKEIAIKKAQEYADEHNIPVAIYQEQGEWRFSEAFSAYASGYNVVQVVSKHY